MSTAPTLYAVSTTRNQLTYLVRYMMLYVYSPNVPKEYLTTRGAVLLLSVFDYDRLKWDDFAGEVAVHLSHLAPLSMDRSVDRMPVIMMPLKRPTADHQGPFSVSGGMHAAFLSVCVESCERSRFCVEVFMRHNYINFNSFIYSKPVSCSSVLALVLLKIYEREQCVVALVVCHV